MHLIQQEWHTKKQKRRAHQSSIQIVVMDFLQCIITKINPKTITLCWSIFTDMMELAHQNKIQQQQTMITKKKKLNDVFSFNPNES